MQLYIFILLEIILKCQSVLFITFLGEKFMAETAYSLHLYDLILQDVFQWAMCLFHSASSCKQYWINRKEAFYPPCGFSQSSWHNGVAKVGLHHMPIILSYLVCLDVNLLILDIWCCWKKILKCQSLFFITFLRKRMAEKAHFICFI